MVRDTGGAADGVEDMGRVMRCFRRGKQPIWWRGVNAMDAKHTFVLITNMSVFQLSLITAFDSAQHIMLHVMLSYF